PVPEGVDYNDADTWNAGFAEKFASGSWPEVLQRLDAAHDKFRSALATIADEERFAEGKTVYRIAHNSAIDHYKEHAEAIRDWAKA
ncbi:MAG TPA: ClbS/DfsB family four-helix bundle protein, partial [Dehalococcoidia bacterium]|nr:ClbS/DfsB family four-helix bundle protein [Dehalococcoidia bacterium]